MSIHHGVPRMARVNIQRTPQITPPPVSKLCQGNRRPLARPRVSEAGTFSCPADERQDTRRGARWIQAEWPRGVDG